MLTQTKRKHGIKQILGAVILGFSISLAIAIFIVGHSLVQSEQRALETASRSRTVQPIQITQSKPPVSQEAIAQAIELYQIRLPENVETPTLDRSLTDRGLTVRRGAWAPMTVTIGPDAFSSWSLLGSTIAHEVEVHCRQNFVAIHLMDLAGLDGTGFAEREAYDYELKNADRFGLAPYDRDLIRSTASYFYPKKSFAVSDFPSLRNFLSRLSMIEPKVKNQVKPIQTGTL